jgi:rhamnopyranosyl-N-acetylglucosaminyl-diphospho-decaprenol beta-1,3/1,4-galactofuranosyltransferase
MRLLAVLVTYNRLAKIQPTLGRLLAEPALDAVLVVDNASADGTGAWLREEASEHPRLEILTLAENRGGAGGFHAGLARALERNDWDHLLLQDDDAWPADGCLARFATQVPRASAAAAAVYFPDGRICDMNRPRRVPFLSPLAVLRQRGMALPDSAYAGDPTPIDMSSFVGLFLSRAAVEAVGLPDPAFFLYGDDWDYTLRLRKAGHRILFAPGLPYIHDCGSLKAADAPYARLWQWYYSCRNALILQRKMLGPLAIPLRWLRLRQWRRQCPRYPDPAQARATLALAVRDASQSPTPLRTPDEVERVVGSFAR